MHWEAPINTPHITNIHYTVMYIHVPVGQLSFEEASMMMV
jgi:hypothetical protein